MDNNFIQKTKQIAVDCGKSYTKTIVSVDGSSEIRESALKTTVLQLNDDNKDTAEHKIIIEKLNIAHIVGAANGTPANPEKTSKTDDIHKISLYYAIASNVNHGDYVDIAITLPLNEYMDDVKNVGFQKYMFPIINKPIECVVDDNPKTFTIRSIHVFPECAGVTKLHPDLFKDKEVALFDGGGCNFNVLQVVDGIPNVDANGNPIMTVLTNVGSQQIQNTLIEKLNEIGLTLTNKKLEKALEDGCSPYGTPEQKDESKKVIETVLSDALDTVFSKLRGESWKTLNQMDYVFTGGTSDLLRATIEKKCCTDGRDVTILPQADARWANVRNALNELKKKIK